MKYLWREGEKDPSEEHVCPDSEGWSAQKQVSMLRKKGAGKIILEMACLLGGKDRMEENIQK